MLKVGQNDVTKERVIWLQNDKKNVNLLVFGSYTDCALFAGEREKVIFSLPC